MNSHDLTIAVYLLAVVVGLVLEFVGSRPGSRVPSLGTVFRRVMRTRSGRVGVIAGWAWLGLHFFAR
jgi:hypothetical protein